MLKPKDLSLVRLSAYVLIAFCAVSVISASSIMLFGKSYLDDGYEYTKNVIARNIQTGGLPYALITKDRESLQSIAEAQLAYREVHGITVKDSSGRVLYRGESLGDGDAHSLVQETIEIVDTREPIAISDFEVDAIDPVLGYVEIIFTTYHANAVVTRLITTSVAISIASLLILIAILGSFNRAIARYVAHVMSSLQRLKSGGVIEQDNGIKLQEFKKIHDDIVKTSRFLAEKDRSLRAAYEAEKAAKTESQKAAKFRDEIVKSVSHDLRTPVTVIDGLLRIIERSIQDANVDDLTKHNLELCISSSSVLKDIVEEIFDFDQFYSSELRNSPSEVDVVQLISPLGRIYREKCREKGLDFFLDVHKPDHSVYRLDAGKLTRIVENLLQNALKFTDRGTVSLAVSCEPRSIAVTVKDTGIGIPEERMQDIFVEYIRVEQPEIRSKGGRGLGLSYVKALCEAIGAGIEVRSVVGIGSSFVVSLPAEPGGKPATLEPLRSDTTQDELRCLVIDDSLEICHLMKTLLAQHGIAAETESIPELGLEAIRRQSPDIVFVDYHMPGLDGLTLSRLIRDEVVENSVTLVAVTADAHTDTQAKLAENFDFVLTKPINERCVQEILRTKSMAVKALDTIVGGKGGPDSA